jgi:putative DNA primase/helicase
MVVVDVADGNLVAEIMSVMRTYGIIPVEDIAGALAKGALVRFHAVSDRPGRPNGWAVVHLDERPAGAFGHWRLGVAETWRVDRDKRLSPAERQELARKARERQVRREAERRAGWERAAAQARALWRAAGPADRAHPYLARKIMTSEGLRQRGAVLLVPMRDASGQLRNIQHIAADGTKRFLRGGRTAGLYWSIGTPGHVICLAEGAATAAAVHRCTGHASAAAFSASNLESVARILTAKFPAATLIVCADNDDHLDRNVGIEAARSAAAATGALVAVPGDGNG